MINDTKSLLWITGGSEGLAVARKLHDRADILCWGDYIMYGDQENMPQYRVQDQVSQWLREADMSSNDKYLITDGFQSFAIPHLLEGNIYRSALDFDSDLGGGRESKSVADLQRSAIQARILFQKCGVSSIPLITMNSIQDAFDFLKIDFGTGNEIVVNGNYFIFPSSKSTRTWLDELCHRTRVKAPIFISTLPKGFRAHIIGLFHEGKPIAAPLLDLGGSVCSISPNSPMYTNTLEKIIPFLIDQNWTGPISMGLTVSKDEEGCQALATNLIAEMRHCNVPSMYELYPGNIEEMIYDILEGAPIHWKGGWSCYSKMLVGEQPNLEPVWIEDGIEKHANLWWCDVIETETVSRLTGKHFCTLTQSHKKDPRKATSQIKLAEEKIVSPDHIVFPLGSNDDAFKNFSALTNWELCKSEWRTVKKE